MCGLGGGVSLEVGFYTRPNLALSLPGTCDSDVSSQPPLQLHADLFAVLLPAMMITDQPLKL